MVQRIRRQKAINLLHTGLLVLGMLALVLALGYLLFGGEGMIWAAGVGSIMLFLSMRIPTRLIMRFYRGRELAAHEAPQLMQIVQTLSQRAGLSRPPRLYYIPNQMLNAFATGDRRDPAIALTFGLMTQLSTRELTAVLAHEISHIRHNDYRLKGMVNIMGRITRMFSNLGLVLLVVNLPLFFMGEEGNGTSWQVVALLLFAPIVSALMMNALSRTREHDADLEAARLTGDPNALADALLKLNYLSGGGVLQRMMPRFLSSHPQTRERVRRLQELAPQYVPAFELPESLWPGQISSPLFRRTGWWF